MTVSEKKCSRCDETKPVHEFTRNPRSADGLSYYCFDCRRKCKSRSRGKALVRHYEEKYQHLLTQQSHPGYIYRSWDSPYNGKHCRAVMLTRFGKTVVEFDDGVRIAASQVNLRRAKED